MNNKRRSLLKGVGSAGAVSIAAAAGLLKPTQAFALSPGFSAGNLADAMKSINASSAVDSNQIEVKVPDIAENGAAVSVIITSNIAGTDSIAIIAEKNLYPLTATFKFQNGAEGYVATRIKLGQTSNVRAVVKAGGKVFTAVKEVKVTLGGCGG